MEWRIFFFKMAAHFRILRGYVFPLKFPSNSPDLRVFSSMTVRLVYSFPFNKDCVIPPFYDEEKVIRLKLTQNDFAMLRKEAQYRKSETNADLYKSWGSMKPIDYTTPKMFRASFKKAFALLENRLILLSQLSRMEREISRLQEKLQLNEKLETVPTWTMEKKLIFIKNYLDGLLAFEKKIDVEKMKNANIELNQARYNKWYLENHLTDEEDDEEEEEDPQKVINDDLNNSIDESITRMNTSFNDDSGMASSMTVLNIN